MNSHAINEESRANVSIVIRANLLLCDDEVIRQIHFLQMKIFRIENIHPAYARSYLNSDDSAVSLSSERSLIRRNLENKYQKYITRKILRDIHNFK